MSIKIGAVKVSADGEQLSFEYILEKEDYAKLEPHTIRRPNTDPTDRHQYIDEIVPGKQLIEILRPYLQFLDDRLFEMNKRVMAMNYLTKKLPGEAQVALNNVLDVLHGKSTGPATEEVLKAAREEYEAARSKLEAEEALKATVNKEKPK